MTKKLICGATIIVNAKVHICQSPPGHFEDHVHEDGKAFWEVISDSEPVSVAASTTGSTGSETDHA